MKSILALTFAIFPLAAAAQPPTAPAPECLRQINIWDFKARPDNRSLLVTDKSRRKYLVSFVGYCPNIRFHMDLAFKTRSIGSLSCVDQGDSVLMRDEVGPRQCIIKSVEPYTAAMEKADADAAAAKALAAKP